LSETLIFNGAFTVKKLVCLVTLIVGTSLFASEDGNISWKDKTRINLDTMYKTLKKTHPKAKDSDFYLGRAYGISLDKVKRVSSEEDFVSVIVDFGNILNHPSVEISSDKKLSSSEFGKIKDAFQLPYGGLSVITHNFD